MNKVNPIKQSGPRGTRRKMVLAAVLPLACAAALFAALMRGAPEAGAGEAAARADAARLAPLAEALQATGATLQSKRGTHRVTLPRGEALTITPAAARELALEIRQHSGGTVILLSPAGQILAEVP